MISRVRAVLNYIKQRVNNFVKEFHANYRCYYFDIDKSKYSRHFFINKNGKVTAFVFTIKNSHAFVFFLHADKVKFIH